jgi:tRNA nucleotidyltransferase (CCA-adding enzyme)
MDLIVTHKNTDFDALSSLVAAEKLYPGARLLLPGSQEKAVRRFLGLIKDKIRIEREKTCRMDDVDRIIIVDNRHLSRIGEAARVVSEGKAEVHIYDHHPRTRGDIEADVDVFKQVGATVSILLEMLLKKNALQLTPLEATLMLLGIYEETGSLSYSSTTKLDVEMVSRLLDLGANLNAVSSYLNRELSEKELATLIDLLGSVETVSVKGVDVAFAHVEAVHFQGEMGTVVHKLQDVENYPVLFVIFRSRGKIKIMARSRTGEIDVNRILSRFGGGGHPSAASATVTKGGVRHIKTDIIRSIEDMIRPVPVARDIMSSPVRTFTEQEKVSDVKRELEEMGIKGAPVLDERSEPAGMITMRDIKKALRSGMGHSRIKGYMSRPLVTVGPMTPLHRLREILIKEDRGRIPVVENGRLAGIVTRTDVLRQVHGSLFPEPETGGTTDIGEKMREVVPERMMRHIKEIGHLADARGTGIFLVGGFVRDVLLGKRNFDLDIVVEGNAIDFGRELAHKLGAALVTHKKFGTCSVVTRRPGWTAFAPDDGEAFKIDIATARKEIYDHPAALPTVEFSSLREDLLRRDFTINAMAVNINERSFGSFVDFFGGAEDLEKGLIRILHDRSFIDDPTRIFRAVRFEQRFGFTIEKHTEYLIQHAVKKEMFMRTEKQRIRDELILMLKEPDPEKAVHRMRQLHELRFIHEGLTLPSRTSQRFRALRKAVDWYYGNAAGCRELDVWLMNLMIVLERSSARQIRDITRKFVFRKSDSVRLNSLRSRGDGALRELARRKRMRPSEIYGLLEPLSHEVTLYLSARTTSVKAVRRIHSFLKEYNGTRLLIRGEDLKREGVEPGPRYAGLLDRVLREKLDKRFRTREEELDCLRKVLAREDKER